MRFVLTAAYTLRADGNAATRHRNINKQHNNNKRRDDNAAKQRQTQLNQRNEARQRRRQQRRENNSNAVNRRIKVTLKLREEVWSQVCFFERCVVVFQTRLTTISFPFSDY